ncbi:MAG: DNA polymerase III subunit alpha [Microgenomates group bacterium]|jgi:DNA polymerase-3 subunit alpha
MPKFVHLHGHSEYSLLDGLSKIKKLVKVAKEYDMPAIAVTDHGVMYGAIEFYKSALEENIKPIVGCEVYVAKRSHKDKEGKIDTEPYHLTLLAKNYKGYKNLMKLVSIAHLDGYYYKPRVDKDLLKEYHEGIIALSGCPGGEFAESLKPDSFKDGEEIARKYLEIFGEGNYFMELQNHEYESLLLKHANSDPKIKADLERMANFQKMWWKAVKEISPKIGVPIVATNDYHYVKQDDANAQDAVLCVQTGKFIKDIDRLRMIDTPNLYIRSGDEMANMFSEVPDAISNTVKVADMTNLEIPLGKAYFPIFDIPQGLTPMDYLRQLCEEGFNQKYPEGAKLPAPLEVLRERLEYELSVIEKKNYPTYFLIVSDFIKWSHDQRIITNTRGSAAGSLVLFCLGVTNIDPIAYMLPFERFLNPMRPSLPDIDSDIADDRRDDVIRYIRDKYGQDKVAHIITYGTMMGRAAIRDIGRVLGLPYGQVDGIAKLVPPPRQGFHQTLDDALKEVPELSVQYKQDPEVRTLIDLAKKVEGTIRHASVHAAGLVIAPTPLTDFTPIQRESKGEKIVTQYEMHAIEDVGLVKMDMLGIRNLSILGRAVAIVKETHGLDIDLNNLPLDDEQSSIHPEYPKDGCKKTYELLGRGDTIGLFQLEGSGMTKYLVDLKPTNIFDISAMVALYRPGPLAIIPEYIARKHNPKLIKYFDPRMEEYLQRSLGLLVYQDDVLLTAIKIAGYDWEEADKFRKAMGKKIPAEMAKQKDHFITGSIKNGMDKKQAEELFKLIEPFAAYGFNKAHAASYAMVAYQTAYMKANYTAEFMAAVMTAEYGDPDKISAAMEECKRLGIIVLPPDVNKSKVDFTLQNIKDLTEDQLKRQIGETKANTHEKAIIFGLSAIKNVGISAIESILKARQKGEFKSLADLCSRVDNRLVNKKTLESLIKSGAMDSLGSRASQLLVMEQILEKVHQNAKKAVSGQVGLFSEEESVNVINIDLPEIEELALDQMLAFEKDLLGFYLHEPPYIKLLAQIGKYTSYKISDLSEHIVGQKVVVGGVIMELKKVLTKKNQSEMAFLKISDLTTEIETVVFPKTYEETKHFLTKDTVVIIWAKVDNREDKLSLVIDNITPFDPNLPPDAIGEDVEDRKSYSSEPKTYRDLEIMVPKDCGVDILQKVNKTLRGYPGKKKVAILLPSGGSDLRIMDLPFGVNLEPLMIEELEQLLGIGAVIDLSARKG